MESILLSNIAAILVKDVLIDDGRTKRKICKLPTKSIPLLVDADTDDEAFRFVLKQKHARHRLKGNDVIVSKSGVGIKTTAKRYPGIPNRRISRLEINLINKFSTVAFERHLHMGKITFLQIFKSLSHCLPNEQLPTTAPPQTIFSIALWKLSTNEQFEEIQKKFKVHKRICQQLTRLFWRRISTQYELLIQWPSTPEKCKYTLRTFQAHAQLKKFQNLFGILAIQRFDIFLEDDKEERQVIMQIICDADQKLIDCFLALASEYSFDNSPIGKTLALNEQAMPTGSYLVGDENFPLKSYLMRPIGTAKDKKEQSFNAALQPVFDVAQQVLNAMAKRFNVLYALEAHNLHEARKMVDTICVLHNLCVEMEDDYTEKGVDDTQFNWAKLNADETKKLLNVETDENGKIRRAALMSEIIY